LQANLMIFIIVTFNTKTDEIFHGRGSGTEKVGCTDCL